MAKKTEKKADEAKAAGSYDGIPIFISDRPAKKYYALFEGKKVYFGAKDYQHFRDVIGFYSDLDHGDPVRRNKYYARHSENYPRGSADWLSKRILWPKD